METASAAESYAPSVAASASSSATTAAPSTATALQRNTRGINQISAVLGTPPGCPSTQVFDMSELDDGDLGGFSLDGHDVMMIQAVGPDFYDDLPVFDPAPSRQTGIQLEGKGLVENEAGNPRENGDATGTVEEYILDGTDHDGDWTFPWYEPNLRKESVIVNVLAITTEPVQVEVIVDSGADVSVAPQSFAGHGLPAESSGFTMHDAQGNEIRELNTRLLDIEVSTLGNESVKIREKFAIAAVSSVSS